MMAMTIRKMTKPLEIQSPTPRGARLAWGVSVFEGRGAEESERRERDGQEQEGGAAEPETKEAKPLVDELGRGELDEEQEDTKQAARREGVRA